MPGWLVESVTPTGMLEAAKQIADPIPRIRQHVVGNDQKTAVSCTLGQTVQIATNLNRPL